jgi:hypothetical protein
MSKNLRTLLALTTLIYSSASAAPIREYPPYRGGPLAGISVGEVVRPDNGNHVIGLKPSKPNASPIPVQDEPAVHAFVDAFENRDLSKLNGFLDRGAKLEPCHGGFYDSCGSKVLLTELKVTEDCTFNTPYYLGDHTVRLEWLFKGALWYWSEVFLKNGKIRLVRMHRPAIPPNSL